MISYTHDSEEHKARVLNLANQLRGEGIDCRIDQYEPFPKEGWARWMQRNINEADYVIVVCTETYLKRFEGNEEPGRGLGGQWEGFMITQDLYEAAVNNVKFIPVVLSPDDANYIPITLRASTRYRLDLENGYDDLYRLITNQPLVAKPPLGPRRVLSTIAASHAALNLSAGAAAVTQERNTRDIGGLILIFVDENKFTFIPSLRIERGAEISLELLPSEARSRAFLGDLNGEFYRPPLAIAYGDTVVEGQVESVTTVHEKDVEVWKLKLKSSKETYNYSLYEITFNGVAAEEIAELRARRILLNDKPSFPRGRNRLEEGMIESMIGRAHGLIQRIVCPLPNLYETFGDNKEQFLVAARLICILHLKLTGIVEHVFKLDISFEAEATLRVSFEGQRHARYSNVPPQTIAFDGLCKLAQNSA